MRVLSFSLYGDNPKYTIGAIKNSEVREQFYPDWQMRVYNNDSVPNYVLEQLEANNVVLINTKVDQNVCNAMWRFAPASEEPLPSIETTSAGITYSSLLRRAKSGLPPFTRKGISSDMPSPFPST